MRLPIDAMPEGEMPSCRYCIYRDADEDVKACIKHAPTPMVKTETGKDDDDALQYTAWPLANLVCADGAFLVGEPPHLAVLTYDQCIAKFVHRINELVRLAEANKPVPSRGDIRKRVPSIVKERMKELFRAGEIPIAVYEILTREFGQLPFTRGAIYYWYKKLSRR